MSVRLTAAQERVVNHHDGPLLVVAGPGSGKTRVLTERIRRLLQSPGQHFKVLALTFTNKAANEMKERLDDVPDTRTRAFVGTLHSFCLEVLANRGKPVGIDGLPNIFENFDDRRQVLINAVRSEPRLSTILRRIADTRGQQQVLGRWLSRISELKNSLILPAMVEDEDERLLYECYDSELRASAALDYDDLLLLTYRLFSERPKVAEYYQRQYRYICIDEAQDLNEAQYRLLLSLCGSGLRNVMMVGDPQQAIYVWNGADPKYLDMFQRDFAAERVALTDNFRCSNSVVEAAKRLDGTYSVQGQLPVNGLLELIACCDEADEASVVVAKIGELMTGGHADVEGPITLDRMAVLGRTRFVFGAIEEELTKRGLSYYMKLSAAPYQSESDVMEGFELALRLLSNPRDRLHLEMLVNAWGIRASDLDYLNRQYAADGVGLVQHLADSAEQGCAKVVKDAVDAMQCSTEDFRFLRAIEKIEAFAAKLPEDDRALVLQDTREWRKHWDYYVRSETGGHHSIASFLGQIALGITQQPKEDGLALLTVHSAKGLEFDVVFLIGMNEGTFPDYRAKGRSMEEERRSAFVAVTRSKRLLYVTYPKVKIMPWGDMKPQQPSRFVTQMFG